MESMGVNEGFWKKRKVLVTGHTGFKGSWLSIWLLKLGADVLGYALEPATGQDNFVMSGLQERMRHVTGNILDSGRLEKVFHEFRPEIVFHLAAQPLVRLSYEQPKLTYETNVTGTLNVLEAIRKTASVKSAVMITTDKCYENKETDRGYRETDPLGGYDPYSSSKACAEILTASYRRSFFLQNGSPAVATARAGNVIGGGDWARDRIVPDCIRALRKGEAVVLRNPRAIRPWQFVLEPLKGYLMLAEKLWEQPEQFAGGWNFGPEQDTVATVEEVAGRMLEAFGGGRLEVHRQPSDPHEAGKLVLDITKAKTLLGWKPVLDLKETVKMTGDWYRECQVGGAYDFCLKQIDEYTGKGRVSD